MVPPEPGKRGTGFVKRYVPIQLRFIIAFLVLAVFTIGICTAAYYYLAMRDLEERVQRELDTAGHVHRIALREKSERARLIARIIASDSVLEDYVLRREIGELDALLWTRARDLPADIITVTDENGAILSQVEPAPVEEKRQIRHGDPLFLDALFSLAVQGGNPTALELCKPDVVCMNAFAPVTRSRGRVAGYVRVGFALDDVFAKEMRRITGTEFILVREGRTAASSLPGEKFSTDELTALMDTMNRAMSREEKQKEPERDKEAAAGLDAALNKMARTQVQLRGRPYVLEGIVLDDAAGRELGRLFIGRNTLEAQRARRAASRAVAIIVAVALPLSIIFGLALSVPMARPLKQLLDRVRDITRGNLGASVSMRRNDEIGRLADAFNDMTQSLNERDKRLRENARELLSNQEQIIQSGKLAAVGELAAGVAHEIGNPLSAISGYAQMLKKGGLPHDTVLEYAGEIEKEADFIERIIQDLLDFARPAKEGPAPHDIHEILESALKTSSSIKAFQNVKVTKQFAEDLPRVLVSRKDILQVCLNLFVNAAQAMPQGGKLLVSTEAAEHGAVTVTIADRGPGIPEDAREKIFDPFFTTKPQGQGTGLGLSICYRIVEKYGGAIGYTHREGGGAVFTVTLPAAPQEDS